MWFILLSLISAVAAPPEWEQLPRGFARLRRAPRPTRYGKLVGEGPLYGRWRRASGAYRAYRFRDGQISSFEQVEKRKIVLTRTFDAAGHAEESIDWVGLKGTVHFAPPVQVSMEGWVAQRVGGLQFLVPPGERTEDGGWRAPGVVISVQEKVDPFDPVFEAQIAAHCRCVVTTRYSRWIRGQPAAHFRLERTGYSRKTADLVAWPSGEKLIVFAAAGTNSSDLAPLRVVLASARKE